MKTFSRGQQGVVLLIIFGMTLIYFNSIVQPTISYKQLSQPATDHRPLTTVNLSGSELLTINKRININTATKTDLEAIRGIGAKTAEKIIDGSSSPQIHLTKRNDYKNSQNNLIM